MTKSRFVFVLLALVAVSCGGSVAATPDPVADTGTVVLVDSAVDTTIPSDAAAPPTEGGIGCGMTTCDPAKQECCAGLGGAKCVDKGACTGGTPITCSGPEHCAAGEVCCADREGMGGKVACATICMGLTICREDKDCTPPATCRPGLGGYRYCRGPLPDGGFIPDGFVRPDAPREASMEVTPG